MADKPKLPPNPTADQTILFINKYFGDGSIMALDDKPKPVPHISSGNFVFDHASGIGGIPRGKMVELFGNPSSGKSTLSIVFAIMAQMMGLRVHYNDYEHSFDPAYAQRIGMSTKREHFLISQPTTAEEGLGITRTLIENNVIGLSIQDSVAAMTPQSQLDGELDEMGKVPIGLHSRIISAAVRMLTATASNHNCTILWINQLRTKIGTRHSYEETTGGKALKFYASQRIELRNLTGTLKKKKMKNALTGVMEDITVSIDVLARFVKNKCAPPFRECILRMIPGEGFDMIKPVIDVGVGKGLFQASRAGHFDLGEIDGEHIKVRGYNDLRVMLLAKPELLKKLEKMVIEAEGDASSMASVETGDVDELETKEELENLASGDKVAI